MKVVSDNSTFNNSITGVIILASVMVGLGEDDVTWAGFNGCEGPEAMLSGACKTSTTDMIDWIILYIFGVECVIKIVAEGVYPWRYLYYKREGGVNRTFPAGPRTLVGPFLSMCLCSLDAC